MNIQPDEKPTTISDDQDLAKALAGADETEAPETEAPEETPEPEDNTPEALDVEITPAPTAAPEPEPAPETVAPVSARTDLDDVKMEAIKELRPIVDKLELPPDEKFDTYLLLIRCTDDRTLVSPAHEVAKQIEVESRRAQALLDVIKEIEYLSSKPDENEAPGANSEPNDQFTTDLTNNLENL